MSTDQINILLANAKQNILLTKGISEVLAASAATNQMMVEALTAVTEERDELLRQKHSDPPPQKTEASHISIFNFNGQTGPVVGNIEQQNNKNNNE